MMTQSPIDVGTVSFLGQYFERRGKRFQRKRLEEQQPQQCQQTTSNRRPSGSNQDRSDRTGDFVFPHDPSGVHQIIRRGDERIAKGGSDLKDDIALLVQDSTDFVFPMVLHGEKPTEAYFVVFPQVRSSIDEVGYIPGLDFRLDSQLLLLGTKRKIIIDDRGKNRYENGDDGADCPDAAGCFPVNRTSCLTLE
jgi:hypothetical protein